MTYILVSVDDSPASRTAVQTAAELATKLDLPVHIIHGVEQTTHNKNGQLIQESLEDAENRGYDILEKMLQETPQSVETTTELVYGDDTVSAVVDFISEEKSEIEQVFIGHRQLNGREKQLVGSFAESLIEHSPVPITVVGKDGSQKR